MDSTFWLCGNGFSSVKTETESMKAQPLSSGSPWKRLPCRRNLDAGAESREAPAGTWRSCCSDSVSSEEPRPAFCRLSWPPAPPAPRPPPTWPAECAASKTLRRSSLSEPSRAGLRRSRSWGRCSSLRCELWRSFWRCCCVEPSLPFAKLAPPSSCVQAGRGCGFIITHSCAAPPRLYGACVYKRTERCGSVGRRTVR